MDEVDLLDLVLLDEDVLVVEEFLVVDKLVDNLAACECLVSP
jgi:hypothetical protein